MGIGKSAEKKSLVINKRLAQEHIEAGSVVKILLLGTGNSGKSTILKQFNLIHNNEVTSDCSVEELRSVVSENVLMGLTVLVEGLNLLDSKAESSTREVIHFVDEKRIEKAEKSADSSKPDMISIWEVVNFQGQELRICDLLLKVWEDRCVQEVLNYHANKLSKLEIQVDYFFEEKNYSRICNSNYVPSREDLLYSRQRTTGMATIGFQIDGFNCKLFDVGGQRNERKKWISHFDNVDVVIFLVSLADYCKNLLEDPDTNRLQEALIVFRDIIEGPFFENNNFILFLNKKDLFEQLVTQEKLKDYFPEYTGSDNAEEGLEFISNLFETEFRNVREAQGIERQTSDLFIYRTTATSTENIQAVFGMCKHVLLMKNLANIGMF